MKFFKHACFIAAAVALFNCSDDAQTSPDISENESSSETELSSDNENNSQNGGDTVESSDGAIDESSDVGGDPIDTDSSEENKEEESSDTIESSEDDTSSVLESSSSKGESSSSLNESSSDNDSSDESLSSSIPESHENALGDSTLVIENGVLNIGGIIIEGARSIKMDKDVIRTYTVKDADGKETTVNATHERRFNLMVSNTRPPMGFVSYFLDGVAGMFPYQIQIDGQATKSPYEMYKQILYLFDAEKKLHQITYLLKDVGQYIMFYRTTDEDGTNVINGVSDYTIDPWRVRYEKFGGSECRDTDKNGCTFIETVEEGLVEAQAFYDAAEPLLSSSSTTVP
ncbi:MAG: hypothetical protein OCD01_10730 [Fibrobacterales bacterium]